MRKITKYIHHCERCDRDFESKFKAPIRCGKCKSPYWNKAKRERNLRLVHFVETHPNWTQEAIGRQFHISQVMVSKIIKRFKEIKVGR